jgi:hypothetical protein
MTPRRIVLFLLGGVAGALSGAGLMWMLKSLGVSLKSVTYFDILCTMIAAFFIALGLVQAGVALNRRQLGKILEGGELGLTDDMPDTLPATDSEVRTALFQAAVLALAGLLMLVPIAALGPMKTHPGLGPWIFAGIFVLFLVQSALNFRIWQQGDEFIRQTILVMYAATFAITQSVLFLWAAAEHLSLVPAISAWNIYTLLMTCYIGVNFVVSLRIRR